MEQFLLDTLEKMGVACNKEQLAQFMRYQDLLLSWNEKMNLTVS